MNEELSNLGYLGVVLYPDAQIGRYFAIGQVTP